MPVIFGYILRVANTSSLFGLRGAQNGAKRFKALNDGTFSWIRRHRRRRRRRRRRRLHFVVVIIIITTVFHRYHRHLFCLFSLCNVIVLVGAADGRFCCHRRFHRWHHRHRHHRLYRRRHRHYRLHRHYHRRSSRRLSIYHIILHRYHRRRNRL